MAKPTLKQAWMPLALAAMTFATAYLGNDKYQQSQIVVEATDVNVAITSMPSISHIHRSTENIQGMIDKAVEAQRKEHEEGGKFHG